jgi:5-methylcytosine-specific restriction endonuclease McrA
VKVAKPNIVGITKPANDNEPVRYGPWLPTKKVAKACGAKHYFTGLICKHGHIAPRLTSNGACMDCHNLRCGERHKIKRQTDEEWRTAANEKQKQRYHANPQASYDQGKKWRAANQNYVREYSREYQRRLRAADPARNEKTKDSMRMKRLNAAYVEAERQRDRERYARNPIPHRQKSRQYAIDNPEVAATHARNRRARIKQSEGEHTKDEIEDLRIRQKHKCASCGTSTKKSYDVDHIIPISKGGSNSISNLQILCPTCNRQKNNLDPIVFARRKGRLL